MQPRHSWEGWGCTDGGVGAEVSMRIWTEWGHTSGCTPGCSGDVDWCMPACSRSTRARARRGGVGPRAWVHIWAGRVTHLDGPYHTWMGHITHLDGSSPGWAISHIWMGHITHLDGPCHTSGWAVSHTWTGRATHLSTDSSHRTPCRPLAASPPTPIEPGHPELPHVPPLMGPLWFWLRDMGTFGTPVNRAVPYTARHGDSEHSIPFHPTAGRSFDPQTPSMLPTCASARSYSVPPVWGWLVFFLGGGG